MGFLQTRLTGRWPRPRRAPPPVDTASSVALNDSSLSRFRSLRFCPFGDFKRARLSVESRLFRHTQRSSQVRDSYQRPLCLRIQRTHFGTRTKRPVRAQRGDRPTSRCLPLESSVEFRRPLGETGSSEDDHSLKRVTTVPWLFQRHSRKVHILDWKRPNVTWSFS